MKTRKGISPGWLFVAVVAIAMVGAGIYAVTQDQQEAKITPTEFDGEFEQALLDSTDIDSPFANLNGFDNYTVDSDATQGTADVLDQATAEWAVSNETDLGLKDRTAVLWFETDGAMEDVSVELEDKVDGTGSFSSADAVSFESVDFYDYEAAVDQDSLEAGNMNVNFEDVEETSAEAEVGNLQEGEYAVVPTFAWESGETAPTVYTGDSDVVNVLSTMTVEGDTDEDVDEINSLDIQTRTSP